MNFPRNIIVHHSAVSRAKNPNQFDAINNYHRSKGWGKIGYQYLIEADGTVLEGRGEKEVGAHTSQSLMNYRSIGICLTGNFDIEDPTKQQKESLKKLIRKLQKKYRIADKNVYPHRHFAKYKSCWGSRLPDDILGYLGYQHVPKWAETAVKWVEKNKLFEVQNEEDFRDAVKFYRLYNLINDK